MNAMNRSALNAYSKVAVDASVATASPHELVAMLFAGAIKSVAAAKLHMQHKDIAARGKAITNAVAIIDEGLKISLDDKAGGELAQNLRALYEYMCQRLIIANANNEIEPLEEVCRLLSELSGAWNLIGEQRTVAAPTAAAPSRQQIQNHAAVHYGSA